MLSDLISFQAVGRLRNLHFEHHRVEEFVSPKYIFKQYCLDMYLLYLSYFLLYFLKPLEYESVGHTFFRCFDMLPLREYILLFSVVVLFFK